jgi:two-component system, sensor histidine kinase and response regulator
MPNLPEKSYRLLIVDDEPVTVNLLKRTFEKLGMIVETAGNGVECLKKASYFKPDLILLDIIMPVMDGLDACRQLRANPEMAEIPVIFLTMRSGRRHRLLGLRLGAVDYISKPIDLPETVARVQSQLKIQKIHQDNLDTHEILADSKNDERIRVACQGVAQNFSNLLGLVSGYVELIKKQATGPEHLDQTLNAMRTALDRMTHVVHELAFISSGKKAIFEHVRFKELIQLAVVDFKKNVDSKVDFIIEDETPEDFAFDTDSIAIKSTLAQLITNAWEAYPAELESKKIWIQTKVNRSGSRPTLQISVIDQGMGLDATVRPHLFEPFVTTKKEPGRGLGLILARYFLSNCQGEITLEPRDEDAGVCASFYVPLTQDQDLN